MGIFDFFKSKARNIVFTVALGLSACASQSQIAKGQYFLGNSTNDIINIENQPGKVIAGGIYGGTHFKIVDYVLEHLRENNDLPDEIVVSVQASSETRDIFPPKPITIKIRTQDISDYAKKVLKGKYDNNSGVTQLRNFVAVLVLKATSQELNR